MLGGRHLVVFRLRQHTHLPELIVQISHELRYPRLQLSEIVILQLLPSGRLVSEQGPSRKLQVFSLVVELLVDQEVLLLRSALGRDPLRLGVPEEAEDADRLLRDLVHGL